VKQGMNTKNGCDQGTVRIMFFGAIADKVGMRHLDMQPGKSLAGVIQELDCEDFSPFLMAVNQEQVHDMNILLKTGDEVAIMPPFSGG